MRGAGIVIVSAVLVASCSHAPVGPQAPIAVEQVTPGPALDAGAARQTVLSFVDAYAAAPQDDGVGLAKFVAGPELERWVHWLGVQNAQFPGRVDGTSDVRGADFVQTVRTKQALGANVDLSASVAFAYEPVGGDPFERVRILDGPVALIGGPPGDWRVIDFTRDGVPMTDGIQLFEDESQAADGITVVLDSLFMFTPNWQFNLIVENRTGSEIRVDPEATALLVRGQGGEVRKVRGVAAPGLSVIEPATGVQSMVSYPLQASADGRVLHIVFSSGGRGVTFDFPLGKIVSSVPPPPPTDGGTGGSG